MRLKWRRPLRTGAMARDLGQMPAKLAPVIIVKRKKKGESGHHGGAWTVAYADFVTAMMALFIVLWLMSSDEETKKAVSAFFNNPSGPGKLTGTAAAGLGNSISVPKEDMAKLREKIQNALKKVPDFQNLKDHVEITITSDGLRIELMESETGVFFEQGRPAPSGQGGELLDSLARELGGLPNDILIEGHTDSKPYNGEYSNWELSTDRANAARKRMEANGLRPHQVGQVRGFADRQLRHPEDPESAANRRVSVIVQYLPSDASRGDSGDGGKAGASKQPDPKHQ